MLQLPDVVAEVSQMLKRLIGEKIKLTVRHDRDLGPVRADPSQLEQVIVNLAVNARDAMQERGDGSGQLTLVTRRITPADVRAMRNEMMPHVEYTALIVEDTGGGIAPEHLGKIFEPFFTTKEQGRGGNMGGTGLGLSTVYGIVKQSGGFIFADSEPGKGTRFSVYLPVHHGDNQETPLAASLPAVRGARRTGLEWAGGGRVLLVEDEDPVRMVAERALTRAGYTVTSARDGEEGLEQVGLDSGGRRLFDSSSPTWSCPASTARPWPARSASSPPACRCCSCRATPRSSCATRSTSTMSTSCPSRSRCSRFPTRSAQCWRRRSGKSRGFRTSQGSFRRCNLR